LLRMVLVLIPTVSHKIEFCVENRMIRNTGIEERKVKLTANFRHENTEGVCEQRAELKPAIGAVLRHRSTTTAAHYAKVDIPMLLQIAHPGQEKRQAEPGPTASRRSAPGRLIHLDNQSELLVRTPTPPTLATCDDLDHAIHQHTSSDDLGRYF
jgi:hypothetical protein